MFDEIVEFAGVRDFIDEPLRTYSTGMIMRLAFSVAVNVDPDVLIIDEVIAVGDLDFWLRATREFAISAGPARRFCASRTAQKSSSIFATAPCGSITVKC